MAQLQEGTIKFHLLVKSLSCDLIGYLSSGLALNLMWFEQVGKIKWDSKNGRSFNELEKPPNTHFRISELLAI